MSGTTSGEISKKSGSTGQTSEEAESCTSREWIGSSASYTSELKLWWNSKSAASESKKTDLTVFGILIIGFSAMALLV